MNKMHTTTKTGHTVLVLANGRNGGVIAAPPAVLAAVCASLGFRNSCNEGRVFLTAPKMERLGLAAAPSEFPQWQQIASDELYAIAMAVR